MYASPYYAFDYDAFIGNVLNFANGKLSTIQSQPIRMYVVQLCYLQKCVIILLSWVLFP